MTLFAIGMPGPMEMCIIGVIAVILFGKQLPSVARSLGAAIPSFKKGFKDVEKELDDISEELTT